MKPFLDPHVAHPAKFVDMHRIESSTELAEMTRKNTSSCCSLTSPVLLITTNGPCLLAGLLHWAQGRPIPAAIFSLLALASCVFHYRVDLLLRPSLFWAWTDRILAYAGMVYHVYLLVTTLTLWAFFSTIICVGSVFFYTTAYAAWEKGLIVKYVWLHSLWHIGAGLGTLAFALIKT